MFGGCDYQPISLIVVCVLLSFFFFQQGLAIAARTCVEVYGVLQYKSDGTPPYTSTWGLFGWRPNFAMLKICALFSCQNFWQNATVAFSLLFGN
jgi:hypothetical protein